MEKYPWVKVEKKKMRLKEVTSPPNGMGKKSEMKHFQKYVARRVILGKDIFKALITPRN